MSRPKPTIHYRIYTPDTSTGIKSLCGMTAMIETSTKASEKVDCPQCNRTLKAWGEKEKLEA